MMVLRVVFILVALVWLPVGIVATSVIRGMGVPVELQAWQSLVPVTLAGLPLALPCHWLHRNGFRGAAWTSIGILTPVTVGASLGAGLFGPVGIAVSALVISVPAWLAVFLHRKEPGC